jgi:predicted MFS family arabinose efflux permease
LPATQALIPDAVGKRDAMNGIALHSVGMRAVGALGAFAGGGLLEAFGPVKVFMIATSLTWVGAGIILTVRLQKRTKAPDAPRRSVFGDIIDGLRVMFSIPTVRTLLIMAVLIEILCFSYGSVLPVLAKNVLHLDESGLGTLTGMAGVGSLIGAVVITLLSDYKRKGLLMIGVAALYGVGVLSLGASSIWMLSLLVITLVGMSAALFDALQWGLLQANVPDAMRGRAMGGWVFAIGFGWIGHLELGLVSDAYGVQWALGVNGVLVIIVAAIALGKARSLRNT